MDATIGKEIPGITAGSHSTINEEACVKAEILNAEMHVVEAIAPLMQHVEELDELSRLEEEIHKKHDGLRGMLEHLLHREEQDNR